MKTIGLGKIITDNDRYYLDFLRIVAYYTDPDAEVTVDKSSTEIKTKIIPSKKEYRQDIIKHILIMHKQLNIKVDFSKSTNIQENIYYKIDLKEI